MIKGFYIGSFTDKGKKNLLRMAENIIKEDKMKSNLLLVYISFSGKTFMFELKENYDKTCEIFCSFVFLEKEDIVLQIIEGFKYIDLNLKDKVIFINELIFYIIYKNIDYLNECIKYY